MFVAKRYERIGRLEIFKIPENKHKKILNKIRKRFADWKDVKVSEGAILKVSEGLNTR